MEMLKAQVADLTFLQVIFKEIYLLTVFNNTIHH